MSRSYPIWNKVTACIYGSDKSFGAKENSNIEILVGSGPNNSRTLTTIATVKEITDDEVIFKLYIDNQKIKSMHFQNKKGKVGESLYTVYHSNINPKINE